MSETILRADARDETARKVRDEGLSLGLYLGQASRTACPLNLMNWN